jgi:hypothetical protein
MVVEIPQLGISLNENESLSLKSAAAGRASFIVHSALLIVHCCVRQGAPQPPTRKPARLGAGFVNAG